MIPYGRQSISEEDIQAVVNVLKSDFLTQGSIVPKFENAVCEYTGAAYAVAVNSGTSALHLACLAIGLGPGDVLWTSPITFVASANCALYCGADVDFVDIDPQTYNMSIMALEKKLIWAEENNRLPKIVVPVHMAGLSCDMEAISVLAKRYGFYVIEDACHAIGASYSNAKVGSCEYSDIAVFSFHPVKTITTGEGGLATTNDYTLANKMAILRSHGITRDEEQMTHEPDGLWYYQQIDLGFNYRMTDFQAALGLSQLSRLDKFVTQRQQIAQRYNELLVDVPVSKPSELENANSGWHLYIIRISEQRTGISRNQVFELCRSRDIGVNVHYIPVFNQPYYQEKGIDQIYYPEAKHYYAEALSLPIYPDLSESQQKHVVGVLREAMRR